MMKRQMLITTLNYAIEAMIDDSDKKKAVDISEVWKLIDKLESMSGDEVDVVDTSTKIATFQKNTEDMIAMISRKVGE